MKPSELPLLLASRFAAGHDEIFPLDRVRMQKAVFLLTQRGSDDWRSLYTYVPYDWGPYSRELTRDLGVLAEGHFLDVNQVGGSRFGRYTTTPRGEEAAAAAWQRLTERERSFMRAVRAYVTRKGFNALLREVYAEYPQYATKSRFTG